MEKQAEIRQRPVDELEMPKYFGRIPWGQHIEIFTRSKSLEEALFYVGQTIENNWSRSEVEAQIADGLFHNQGSAVTNFADRLPAPQGDLAQELLKGEYNLEFLQLKKKHNEKELEEKIASNITQFLLEHTHILQINRKKIAKYLVESKIITTFALAFEKRCRFGSAFRYEKEGWVSG